MNYQARPKWDKNRPAFLKVGFILAISFALMAFNYTSYPSKVTYDTHTDYPEDILEVIPRTVQQKKTVLPPPPKPIIETLIDIEPLDEPDFTEIEPMEEVIPQDESKTTIVDEYISPVKDTPAPEIVKPIIIEEEEEGPVPIAERMPIHMKCDLDGTEAERRLCTNTNIMESLYKRIKYPSYARDIGLEGTVVVSFVVSKTGEIENVEILRDIGAGCGAEVIKAVKKLGTFYPGKHNGRPVAVIHRLPVKFSLN